jgi:hypothetical protein
VAGKIRRDSKYACGSHIINRRLITLPTALGIRAPALKSIFGNRLQVIVEAIMWRIDCPDNDSQD